MWTTGSNEWVNPKKRGKKRPAESGAGESGKNSKAEKQIDIEKAKEMALTDFSPYWRRGWRSTKAELGGVLSRAGA